MGRKSISAVCAALLAAILLAGCSPERPVKAAVKPEKDRKIAPNFTLKDANGHSVSLSDYRGKVVLLNFWATWCLPCKIEIPWFITFEQTYKDRGFAVLGVSMDEEGWDAVKPYIERSKINYRVMVGEEQLGELYGGIGSLPTTFLIDKDGRIASVHVGLVSKSAYENEIKELLQTEPKRGSRPVRSPVLAFARAN